MKLALLADIHGNYLALRAVLDAAISSGVERLLVAGDLVGYYFEPFKVWGALNEWDFLAVRGNHENMLEKAYNDPHFLAEVDARYGSGLRVAIKQFPASQLSLLWQLPKAQTIQVDACRIQLCHGSPWDTDQYIYPDASTDLLERCATSDHDVVVLGHSHYPMLHEVGRTLVVNPGSVGQPRNRVSGAHWGLLDTDTRTVELRVEPYDMAALISDCRRRHPELPYLSEILLRT
jgi:putative phosphoesterase